MPARPVQVSIDTEMLKRIDGHPETKVKGRSAFSGSAVSSYLRAKRRQDIDVSIRAAYGGLADAPQTEIADLTDAQAWPSD
jgi:metal-responsive CopG/Arc/MetJ family transcriptional regulator